VTLVLAIGGIAYLATYGARTPVLALRGLARVRNLALVIVPAVAVGLVALLLQGRADGRVAAGAIALAVVPAPFVAPEIVGRMRGRADLAGALVLGTALLSLLVSGSRGALAAGALFTAVEAFAIAAMVAGALPTLRDALLGVLRAVGWGSIALIAITATVAAPPLFDTPPIGADPPLVLQSAAVALAMLAAGAGSAALVAWVSGRDRTAAVGGAGLRDPALAVVLASVTAGPDSTAVPLLYGVFCIVLAALSLARR
jgi:hypothetical protein